jgi:NAD(P)-dependent dehydrogenase (short-subunit alcohol dehydrogenase family)
MTGKVALVTGAAAGLGRAVALKLAAAGADLCLVDCAAEGLEATAAEARALGVKVLAVPTDLSVAANCPAAVAAALAEFGRLDALCNVAGVMIPARSHEMPVGAFETTLAVNLAAPFYLFQAAIPQLIANKGAVVNVASAVGITAQAYTAAYCASKAGLIHLTSVLAVEYMQQGVRINAVAPGGMGTALVMGMVNFDGDRQLMDRTSPMRGLVEVGLVADMVAFLASPGAEGYHGSCITIDNGMAVG